MSDVTKCCSLKGRYLYALGAVLTACKKWSGAFTNISSSKRR